jgi:chitinase
VNLTGESGANIHYTLDGTVPTTSDPLYQEPIKLSGPTILRAKAFKTGFTKSITAQEVFIIGD